MIDNNRPNTVLRSMQSLFNHGRLAGTGYLSILPVDQGVEHSAAASLPLTRSILIRKILSSWLSRQAVTVLPLPTVYWLLLPAATHTASRSLSKSTTMKP